MDFRSDNTASVYPSILQDLIQINTSNARSYGQDDLSLNLKDKLTELFSHDLEYVLTSTGTAANCVALKVLTPSYGTIIATADAHINQDEGQAPELFLGGAKIRTFTNAQKKLDLSSASTWIEKSKNLAPHAAKAHSISLTYATEWGETYSLQELRDIRSFCDQHNLKLHIDGARFANALVASNLSATEFVKIVRPDALSFGLTKNGALCAEAVVIFNSDFFPALPYVHKQAAQLMSKTRFIARQFLTLLEKDVWLDLANHANDKAKLLFEILSSCPKIQILNPPKTNQVFASMDKNFSQKLLDSGVLFYHWQNDTYRFVCSWQTTDEELKSLKNALNRL